MRRILLTLAVISSSAAAAPAQPLSVAEVIAKADGLEKKGMLAIFSSDVGLIRAEANRDVQAFASAIQAANREHRPLPACPPRDSDGWKFTFNTDEILKFYRAIPPQQRGMSSVQGFADFMRVKYPCR